MGHSRGYVYNISSGKAAPPLKVFDAWGVIILKSHPKRFSIQDFV